MSARACDRVHPRGVCARSSFIGRAARDHYRLAAVFEPRRLAGALAAILLASACASSGSTPSSSPTAGAPARFGIGRAATLAEIERLDIDVMPDGTGLPAGSGTARTGASIYAARCSLCHGATGTEGPNDRLVGRLPADSFPFGTNPGVRRTVGNYWPWATTLFDYIRRAMPFDSPGSLRDDEVYAVTAWILAENGIIAADSVMDARTLPGVIMPANGRFVPDDRKGGRIIR